MIGFGRRTTGRRPRYQPEAPFSPLQLPGLQLWLRADNATVSTWTDKSGKGNNATQATGANQPTIITSATLGNRPALRGNGTTTFMNLTNVLSVGGSNGACTVAAVFVSQAQVSVGSIISANGFRLLNDIGGSWAYYTAQVDNGVVQALSTGVAYCLVAVQTSAGATSTLTYTNGTKFVSTSTNSTVADNPSTVFANTNGTGQFGQVDIAEIIVSNVAVDVTTIARLRAYVQGRYGFAA